MYNTYMLTNEGPSIDLEKEQTKIFVQNTFARSLRDLEAGDVITFGGFYAEKSNARASTFGGKVSFNEENLHAPEEELERVCWHEIQHGLWSQEAEESEGTQQHWAFAFHPSFEGLHTRMKVHYDGYIQEKYPFYKKLLPLPQTYDDMETSASNYTHPDEVLALLRAYQKYLEQVHKSAETVATQPYEFIEAFIPEDLAFLNRARREDLAREVLRDKPDIVPSDGVGFSLTMEDMD